MSPPTGRTRQCSQGEAANQEAVATACQLTLSWALSREEEKKDLQRVISVPWRTRYWEQGDLIRFSMPESQQERINSMYLVSPKNTEEAKLSICEQIVMDEFNISGRLFPRFLTNISSNFGFGDSVENCCIPSPYIHKGYYYNRKQAWSWHIQHCMLNTCKYVN